MNAGSFFLLFCMILAVGAALGHSRHLKNEYQEALATRAIAEMAFASAQDANIEAAKSNEYAILANQQSQQASQASIAALDAARSMIIEYDGTCQAVMPATGDVYAMECVPR